MNQIRKVARILLAAIVTAQLAPVGARAASYQLDNNSVSTALNASETTEPRDDWFGNVFTAQAGADLITRVDFGVFTTTPNSAADVVLYQVTGAGGNPALGATRVYTQAFTPLTGDGTNAFLQQINLTSPVAFNTGDLFLVSVFIRNVIAAPPDDVYPYLLDTSGNAAGSFWDRSAPNTFNLDNLSGAKAVNQALSGGVFAPGSGHVFIRANGIDTQSSVPDAGATAGLLGVSLLGLTFLSRKLR